MRELHLTIWHLLLVIIIVLGTLISVLAGIHAVLPQWQTPWLLPLLLLVAVDAVVTQWLVERERQTWTEQIVLRIVEATLLIVATRAASLLGEDRPLAYATTWLRDPLAFFGGRFGEYAFLVIMTWITATLLCHRVIQLDTEPPHPSARGSQIDQSVLFNERALAIMSFDRLWLTLTAFSVIGVVLALFRQPLLQVIGAWPSLGLLSAVLGCVLAGVLLHSEGQLDFVRYRWQMEELEVTPAVTGRWRRTTWLLVAGSIILALLFGGFVSNAPPPPPLEPVLNLLFSVLIILTWLVVTLISLLLLPFAWLLSLLRGDDTLPPPRFEPPQLPIAEQTVADRPLLPALIFWGCIILLVGLAVLHYVQQRSDVRALLGRWRSWRWIMRIWKHAVADLQGWSNLALQTFNQFRRPRRHVPRRRMPAVRGGRAQLRALYRRMVRLAARRGIAHRSSQTPYEFSRTLETTLPAIDEEAHSLTDAYVAAEYGPVPPSTSDVRRARKVWRRIEWVLLRKR